jgi:hypothetical protein
MAVTPIKDANSASLIIREEFKATFLKLPSTRGTEKTET